MIVTWFSDHQFPICLIKVKYFQFWLFLSSSMSTVRTDHFTRPLSIFWHWYCHGNHGILRSVLSKTGILGSTCDWFWSGPHWAFFPQVMARTGIRFPSTLSGCSKVQCREPPSLQYSTLQHLFGPRRQNWWWVVLLSALHFYLHFMRKKKGFDHSRNFDNIFVFYCMLLNITKVNGKGP